MEPLFVSKRSISSNEILEKLHFKDNISPEAKKVKDFLVRFIKTMGSTACEKFLMYSTGCKMVPLSAIQINFEKSDGIFGHTCMNTLVLPEEFSDFDKFCQAMEATMHLDSQVSDFKFTTV